jgi:hypothetical protein
VENRGTQFSRAVLTPRGNETRFVMQKLYAVWFLRTAGGLLFGTGLAKVLSSSGTGRVLALEDPILGVAFEKLLLVVGMAELLVAFTCFSRRLDLRLRLGLVGWTATIFLLYRIGLWWNGWHHPCSCMGGLAGALHLSDQAADNIMKGVLAYLLVGSYGILFWQWWRERRAKAAP